MPVLDNTHCWNTAHVMVAALGVGFNQVFGEGLSVDFSLHSPSLGISDARFTFHHSSLELTPAAIELLSTFVRSNSRWLSTLTGIRVIYKGNSANNSCVRLHTICNLLHCVAFSGCRIQRFDLDLGPTFMAVPLHADHTDCRFFGLLVRSFFESVTCFRFHACIGETSSLRIHSVDHILESLCSVWNTNPRPPERRFQKQETLDVHSSNFFEHVSVPVMSELCSMSHAPELEILHFRRLSEQSLCNLSQAVLHPDQEFLGKTLKLGLVGDMDSVNVHNIVRRNRVFRAIRIGPSCWGGAFHPRTCILPLWKTALGSRTDEVVYDIYSTKFTEADLQEARDILHTGFRTNKTLRRFQGFCAYHPQDQELGDVISMYTSINNAKRRKLNRDITAHPPLASTTSECIDVIANLVGKEQEDSARYYVLRRNPHVVPSRIT